MGFKSHGLKGAKDEAKRLQLEVGAQMLVVNSIFIHVEVRLSTATAKLLFHQTEHRSSGAGFIFEPVQ